MSMFTHRELTPSEVQNYNRMSGEHCPECQSDTVRYGKLGKNFLWVVFREKWCSTCKALWVECFTVTGVNVVQGEGHGSLYG